MALGRRLAELLGGSLELESTVGVGSRFRLFLPSDSESLVTIPFQCRLDPSNQALPPRRELARLNGRVLVVEDVKLNRVLLAKILRKAGGDVVCAEDGKQGVEAAQAARDEGRPFDLILMDMQMPVMDGYEATRTLRAEGDDVPIVALTAHAMKGDRDRCIEAGCDDYATKPIDRTEIVELCWSLIDARQRRVA